MIEAKIRSNRKTDFLLVAVFGTRESRNALCPETPKDPDTPYAHVYTLAGTEMALPSVQILRELNNLPIASTKPQQSDLIDALIIALDAIKKLVQGAKYASKEIYCLTDGTGVWNFDDIEEIKQEIARNSTAISSM
jgi:hypothetical protein